jgi:hypothetical protein
LAATHYNQLYLFAFAPVLTMPTTQQISLSYRKLQQQTAKATNEEEIRLAWVRALEEESGITFDAERGKRDLSYNNVVIEFKDHGKFNGRTTSPAFREAMQERLLPYILRAAAQDNIDESDYIGIAIDGKHLVFAQVVGGVICPQQLLPVTSVPIRLRHSRSFGRNNLVVSAPPSQEVQRRPF